MELETCNVLYVDRRVANDRRLTSSNVAAEVEWECPEIDINVKHLLDVFGGGLFRLFRDSLKWSS
jgi:hypothetical protein